MTQSPSIALAALCPLCGAQPGKPCQDAVKGWVRTVGPHLSRIAAAVDPEGATRRESSR
ncbi:hypothetical protein [Mycobacterium sp. smrl_JER01]|uniref:zinc finger domain-containing protein n=1 Tax=Mycobacterium sp. smrl_JER01 TaxID=3402633 RepID=UPI003AF0C415